MRIGSCSHRGMERKHNEDREFTCILPGMAVLSVADGMGGHAAGEVASAIAVDILDRYAVSWEKNMSRILNIEGHVILGIIEEIIMEVNRKILLESIRDIRKRGMGTTLTVGIIKGNELFLGHVGDSRAYLIDLQHHHGDDSIRQLTSDHTMVEEMIKDGRITRNEAKTHRQRHMLTRAVGTHPHLKVDLHSCSFQAGDAVLLCTDGLTCYLDEHEIRNMVDAGRDNPQKTTEKMVALANARGGKDNTTVVLAVDPGGWDK